jgi:hypothetical protein
MYDITPAVARVIEEKTGLDFRALNRNEGHADDPVGWLASLAADAARHASWAEHDLRRHLASAQLAISTALADLDSGRGVNDQGVLQLTAFRVETAAALLGARRAHLDRALTVYRHADAMTRSTGA